MGNTSTAAPMIRLRHPELAGLAFGPDKDEAIQFGNRAGQPQYEAWIPEDHPLLPALLEAHPEVQVVRPKNVEILYPCPWHPDSVFKTRASLLGHLRGQGHDPADLLATARSAGAEGIPAVTAANPNVDVSAATIAAAAAPDVDPAAPDPLLPPGAEWVDPLATVETPVAPVPRGR